MRPPVRQQRDERRDDTRAPRPRSGPSRSRRGQRRSTPGTARRCRRRGGPSRPRASPARRACRAELKPWHCAFCCDFEPGCVVTTATSQPACAATARRAASRADCTPRRRCAGRVAAPHSCAMPSESTQAGAARDLGVAVREVADEAVRRRTCRRSPARSPRAGTTRPTSTPCPVRVTRNPPPPGRRANTPHSIHGALADDQVRILGGVSRRRGAAGAGVDLRRPTEHVLEALQQVAAATPSRGAIDGSASERQLDADRRASPPRTPASIASSARTSSGPAKPRPATFVEGASPAPPKDRDAAGERAREGLAHAAADGPLRAFGHEAALGPLDARGEVGAGEEAHWSIIPAARRRRCRPTPEGEHERARRPGAGAPAERGPAPRVDESEEERRLRHHHVPVLLEPAGVLREAQAGRPVEVVELRP